LGRIRIADEGINATLAGSDASIHSYISCMNSHDAMEGFGGLFAGIEYKFSYATTNPFKEFGIWEVKELTASGRMSKSQPKPLLKDDQNAAEQKEHSSSQTIASSACASPSSPSSTSTSSAEDTHLTPEAFHAELESFDPSTSLLLDVRNAYETSIGTFTHATDPKLRAFHQLPEYVQQNLDQLRSKKKILMYCTGGIRCEKASIYFKHRLPSAHILQLKGGIHRYLETFPEGGMFRGMNFVFDGRLKMGPSGGANDSNNAVGHCVHCGETFDELSDEIVCTICKCFIILCHECRQEYEKRSWQMYCSEHMLLAAPASDGQTSTAVVAPDDGAHTHQTYSVATTSSSSAFDDAAAAPSSSSREYSVSTASQPDDSLAISPTAPSQPSQWRSFLSRFTLVYLRQQLEVINAILQHLQRDKKSASRSRNRKHNLHIQKKRLEEYVRERENDEVTDTQLSPNSERINTGGESGSASDLPSSSSPTAASLPPSMLPFVPFLNV